MSSTDNTTTVGNFIARADTGESVSVVGSANGTFTINGVTPGERTVTVMAPQFNSTTTAARTVASGVTTDFGNIALAPANPVPPGSPF